jgi:cytochrome c oxidase subunit 3
MSIYRSLTEKPWLVNTNSAETISASAQTDQQQLAASGKTAIKFFIAVVSVVFFLFTVTYLSRSQYPDFQALAGDPWLPLSEPNQLWFNTLYLLLASISLQLSTGSLFVTSHWLVKRAYVLVISLTLAVVFSTAFVLGQLQVWQQLTQQGFLVNSNAANSYFYLLTGMHGLHLAGGMLVLVRLVYRYARSKNQALLQQNLTLCTWYWHYLLLLWLFLFALLSATPSTYRTIAAFCGF